MGRARQDPVTPADRTIARMQARIDALEYEVQNLKTAFLDPGGAFPAMKLQNVGRAVLTVLMARDSVTRRQIEAAIEAARPMFGERTENAEKCAILRLRKRLRLYGIEIETLPASGYRMTPEMKAKVREIAG